MGTSRSSSSVPMEYTHEGKELRQRLNEFKGFFSQRMPNSVFYTFNVSYFPKFKSEKHPERNFCVAFEFNPAMHISNEPYPSGKIEETTFDEDVNEFIKQHKNHLNSKIDNSDELYDKDFIDKMINKALFRSDYRNHANAFHSLQHFQNNVNVFPYITDASICIAILSKPRKIQNYIEKLKLYSLPETREVGQNIELLSSFWYGKIANKYKQDVTELDKFKRIYESQERTILEELSPDIQEANSIKEMVWGTEETNKQKSNELIDAFKPVFLRAIIKILDSLVKMRAELVRTSSDHSTEELAVYEDSFIRTFYLLAGIKYVFYTFYEENSGQPILHYRRYENKAGDVRIALSLKIMVENKEVGWIRFSPDYF